MIILWGGGGGSYDIYGTKYRRKSHENDLERGLKTRWEFLITDVERDRDGERDREGER